MQISEVEILEKLKDVEDPELGVNIVDLGLIYSVHIIDDLVEVEMTFTTPFCPYGASLEQMVRETLNDLPGINNVNLRVVFDPPWSKDLMSDEAKLDLGIL